MENILINVRIRSSMVSTSFASIIDSAADQVYIWIEWKHHIPVRTPLMDGRIMFDHLIFSVLCEVINYIVRSYRVVIYLFISMYLYRITNSKAAFQLGHVWLYLIYTIQLIWQISKKEIIRIKIIYIFWYLTILCSNLKHFNKSCNKMQHKMTK